MSDLAIRDEGGEVATQQAPANAGNSALVLWAYEAQQAARIATSLAATSFVPASLRGKPQDVTAAILAGQELGLQPMATLRSMDVIQGTPALRAHAMRGLVQSRGHSVQLVESTETRCRMRGKRAGEEEWQTVTWTIERAAKLGLTNKDQWRKQPQTMLTARATGEICRLIASDVLHAMPYAAEELGDDEPGPVVADAEVRPTRRTARRSAAPAAPARAIEAAPDPEPAFDDEPEPAEPEGRVVGADPEPPVDEPMSGAQQRMMHALFRDNRIEDRAVRLAYVVEAIGREVASSSELTKAEATEVIERLLASKPTEPEPEFDVEAAQPGSGATR